MDWLSYFRRNAADRITIQWERGIQVEPHLRIPLIRSLQRFQIGEQGDGVHLLAGAQATGDSSYTESIRLFVKEEQEHSLLLARVLQGMDARLLQRHWSDTCFTFVRRLSGLRLELLVLMVAELIAKRYYRALREGTNDAVLRTIFAQILRDELGHVAFHCDFLNRAFAPLPHYARWCIHTAWRLFYRAVCLVVMFDHRDVLRATQVSLGTFWYDCGLIFDDAAARIFYPVIDFGEIATGLTGTVSTV